MSNIKIRIEIIPGTEISEACGEVLALARKLNVNASFKFNGFEMFCTPGDSVEELVQKMGERVAQTGGDNDRRKKLL